MDSILKGNLKLWQKPDTPPRISWQPRDDLILRAVFRHRFLQPRHVHALLGGSAENLGKRLTKLWANCYLERPKAVRTDRLLTDQIVYALSKQGARRLQALDARLRIAHLDWTDEPKKQRTLSTVDHQLGIATFFVALEVACRRRGARLHWTGHFSRRRHRIPLRDKPPGRDTMLSDGYFSIERQDGRIRHCFLELDRASMDRSELALKFKGYYEWWRDPDTTAIFPKGFRVLFVTSNADHMRLLRRWALSVGRTADKEHTWKGLWFSHLEAFSLEEPETIFDPIFYYADEDDPVSLLG